MIRPDYDIAFDSEVYEAFPDDEQTGTAIEHRVIARNNGNYWLRHVWVFNAEPNEPIMRLGRIDCFRQANCANGMFPQMIAGVYTSKLIGVSS